jgi:DNA-binding transcriptional ArsR family regulator
MFDLQVIDDPATAAVALDPTRSRILSELAEPISAATLATRVGLARQKVNYHLRALETHGLVRLAHQRKWGGLTERLLVATAASYVVSPAALGRSPSIRIATSIGCPRVTSSPWARGSSAKVGDLLRRADKADKRLATLAIDTEISFASAGGARLLQPGTHRVHRGARIEVPRRLRPRRPRASPGGRGASDGEILQHEETLMSVKKAAPEPRSPRRATPADAESARSVARYAPRTLASSRRRGAGCRTAFRTRTRWSTSTATRLVISYSPD